MREAPVFALLGEKGTGTFVWNNDICTQNIKSIEEIEQIVRTIIFLTKEGYATKVNVDLHPFPDLAQGPLGQTEEQHKIRYAQEFLDKYYRITLKAELSLLGYIRDKFETNFQRKENRRLLIDVTLAVTAIFSATGTMVSAMVALPKVTNIQNQIGTLQQSIDSIYSSYTQEDFCYQDVKDYFSADENGSILRIHLKKPAIPNSVSVWEGALNVNPTEFHVEKNIVTLSTNFDASTTQYYCEKKGYKKIFIVKYIPQQE